MKKTTGPFFLLAFLLWFVPLAIGTEEPRRNIQIQVDIKSAHSVTTSLHQNTYQSNQTQMLLVTEGYEARLFIGKRVPYAVWYQDYLVEEGYLGPDIRFMNVGTQLVVKARIIGRQVEVTLTPEISYETRDGTGAVQVTKLSTQVLVPDGGSVQIGASSSKSAFENRFYTRKTGESLNMVLRPKIVLS